MPSRIVREGINTSRAVGRLPEHVELFYRCLLLVVDDYGRLEADPEIIRAGCFMRRLDTWPVERVEESLRIASETMTDDGAALIKIYQIKAKTYLEISNFNQRIRSHSKVPCPPGCELPFCHKNGHTKANGDHPPKHLDGQSQTTSARATRPHSDSYSDASADSNADAEAGAEAETVALPLALSFRLPADCDKRLRAVAADWPNPQNFEEGIELATAMIRGAPNPEAALVEMEANLPLWREVMRDGSVRTKTLRFVMIDKDYLHKPEKKARPKDKNQTRREEVNHGLEALERMRQGSKA